MSPHEIIAKAIENHASSWPNALATAILAALKAKGFEIHRGQRPSHSNKGDPLMIHPIVGAHYRPPAKAILSALPSGTALLLRPEPTNEADPNAIQVLVESKHITWSDLLDQEASRYGSSGDEILTTPEWHLGYIPRTEAAKFTLDGDRPGRLTFDPTGKPCIEWTTSPFPRRMARHEPSSQGEPASWSRIGNTDGTKGAKMTNEYPPLVDNPEESETLREFGLAEGECDCCGEIAQLTRSWVCGLETWACESYRRSK